MSKRGWVAALGGVLLAASVTVAAGATSASAVNVPLSNALVNRVAGSTTNVTVVNYGVAGNVGPGSAEGATINLTFSSVTKADGSGALAADSVLATWCGNALSDGTPLIGADVGGLAGIAAHCMAIDGTGLTASTDDTTHDVSVSGTLGSLPAGTVCTSSAANIAAGHGPTVIPCLLIVANLAQEVALALPLSNINTAQVAGPIDLATSTLIAACTSAAPDPSRSCPSIRPTTSATPGAGLHPAAFGGIGFYPAANNALSPVNPATWSGSNDLGVVAAGDISICTDVLGTSCTTTGLSPLAAAYGTGTVASPVGQITGGLTISVAPGDYYLKIKYSHYALTAAGLPGHTAIPATGGALSVLQQQQMAPVKVLAAPSCANPTPATGGVGATTSITCSGLDPYQAGTVVVQDAGPFALNSTDVTSNGVGTATASAIDVQYPAASLKVTFATGAEDGAAFTVTKAFDSTQVGLCADPAACSVALITTATVLPGNISAYAETTDFALNDVDLSTIALDDPDSWYPLSEAATSPIVLIGDFTGSNAGFAVTAQAIAMHGATVAANTIPAYDQWYSNVVCDVAGAISGNDPIAGNESLGAVTAGADSAPDPDSDGAPSPLAEGGADICSVAADATTGREGGVFELTFDMQAAGRVNTAADDYAGMIILTVTSAP